MFDSEGFVKAGWVQDLKLYQFKPGIGKAEIFVVNILIRHYG